MGGNPPWKQLDPTIDDLPWQDGFRLGYGYTVTSGVLRDYSAYKDATPDSWDTFEDSTTIKVVRSQYDLDQLLDVSADGSVTYEGVTASASASFAQHITYSSTDLSVVAIWKSTATGFDHLPELEPNSGLPTNSGKFRREYGDYVITGVRRAASFVAIYNLHAETSEAMTEFSATVEASSEGLFTADGHTAFTSKAKSSGVTMSTYVFQSGHEEDHSKSPLNPTPDQIVDLLNAFKAETGKKGYMSAQLTYHHHFIDAAPEKIRLDPDFFTQLQQLVTARLTLTSLAQNNPALGQDFKNEVDNINASFTSWRTSFEDNPDKLKSLTDEATTLRDKTTQRLTDEFFEQLNQYKGDGGAGRVNGMTDTVAFSVGPVPPPYELKSVTKDLLTNMGDGTRNVPVPGMVVGVSIYANWQDGTDGKLMNFGGGIGRDHVYVEVDSADLRGAHWTVTAFYIDHPAIFT
jgi:hypothetical protein